MSVIKSEEEKPASISGGEVVGQVGTTIVRPSQRRAYDNGVTFEEYIHYARQTRAEEQVNPPNPDMDVGVLGQILGRKAHNEDPTTSGEKGKDSKTPTEGGSEIFDSGRAMITDNEWRNASRALRTASWGAGFYLITTDILGPYGVGFAMGTLGWGPGIVLYTVFGFMAGWSGYLLWRVYLGLDSYEFPCRNYGDLAYRTFGSVARHCVNILQTIQLVLICGQVIIQNGQAISQTSNFRLCYIVCIVVFVVAGFGVGQVRTLRNFGLMSLLAVALNLLVIFISMGVMAHTPPNYEISVLGSAGAVTNPELITPDPVTGAYPPVQHYNGLPNPNSLLGSINGLMSGVFAYGGAQIFVEIMAEMRRPWDFLKSMWTAQLFIWTVYLSYGCFTYYYQGQYSFSVSYFGLSSYGFQVTCDMLAVVSGLIAAALYGNIGIKVLYNNVCMDLLGAPPITSTRGKYLFGAIVPVYWSVAFIIGGAIPDYFAFVSIIAAFCVVQFSYTFPPILYLGYTVRKHAMRGDDGFDPNTGVTTRGDGGLRRIARGFFAGRWYVNIWHIIHAGGALCVAGLGAYAGIVSMQEAFAMPQVNSFTCVSPLDLSAASSA